MKTCLVKLKVGDPVIHPGPTRSGCNRRMYIRSICIAPNGMDDPRLVAIIVAEDDNGTVSCTSDKWIVVDDHEYDKHYPSDDL